MTPRSQLVATARLRGPGPFQAVCAAPARGHPWYVAGPDGRRNVLAFPGGGVLTDRETAEAIAERWTAAGPPGWDPRSRSGASG